MMRIFPQRWFSKFNAAAEHRAEAARQEEAMKAFTAASSGRGSSVSTWGRIWETGRLSCWISEPG